MTLSRKRLVYKQKWRGAGALTKLKASWKMGKTTEESDNWCKYAKEYDPIKCGSIDGTDTEPHDRAIIRAINSTYKPNAKVVGDSHYTIFIGRLHVKTDEDKLKKIFERFGKIRRCRVVWDLVTGMSKCYGFIEFERSSSAREAVRKCIREFIDDCEIIVEHECERTLKNWKPRRLGGGFGGRKESGQLRFGGRARPFQKPFDVKASSDIKEIFRQKKYPKF